jgi:hypothetical protein
MKSSLSEFVLNFIKSLRFVSVAFSYLKFFERVLANIIIIFFLIRN